MKGCDNVIDDVKSITTLLVLMNLWIPEIDGEQAIIIIKMDLSAKQIPVIIFSANDEIAEIFKEVNAEGYVKKHLSWLSACKQSMKIFCAIKFYFCSTVSKNRMPQQYK